MTPQERKNRVDELREELYRLIAECRHELLSAQTCSIAVCPTCDKDFGWFCEKSPDGVCHYYTINGKVELLNGTLIDQPKGHDPDNESDDWCIYCGMPEERK